MRFYRLILLLFLCPLFALAQNGTITGKILRADTKAPLAHASVFLGNSSFGTTTAEDGTFTLNSLKPGQYNLVVNAIGYEDHTEAVLVNNEPIKLSIELQSRPIQLKEVKISTLSKADWKLAFELFKEEFIGEDDNARNCKVINPEVLNFSFHQNKNILEAYTDEFLIVENNALGYRIKFLIKNFKSEHFTGNVVYAGQRVFEELKAKPSQRKKWDKKRDEAYYGSSMHFYRSLYKDSLAAAGFKIYRLTRVVDTNRPSDEVIQQNLIKYKNAIDGSYLQWANVKLSSRYAKQTLSKDQLAVNDIFRKTDKPGLFAVIFTDYLYVIYTKRWESSYFKDVYREPDMLNYETTLVSFTGNNQNLLFDSNGIIIGDSPLYEGTWAKARLSEMLPVDYTPVDTKQ
jgi:hypothetical protein